MLPPRAAVLALAGLAFLVSPTARAKTPAKTPAKAKAAGSGSLPKKARDFLDGKGCNRSTDAERVQCGREIVFRACSEFQSMLMLKGCADKAIKSAKKCVEASKMDASIDSALKAYDAANTDYRKIDDSHYSNCARASVTPKRPSPCPLRDTPALADARTSIKNLKGLVDKYRCEFETVYKPSIDEAIATSKQLLADADRYASKSKGIAAAAKEQVCKAYARFDFAMRLCIATGEKEIAVIDARCKKRYDDLVAVIKDYAGSLQRFEDGIDQSTRSLSACGGLPSPRSVDIDGCMKKLPKTVPDYCKADLTKKSSGCLDGALNTLTKNWKAVTGALAKPCAGPMQKDPRPAPKVKFRFPVEDRSLIDESSVLPLSGPFNMDHTVPFPTSKGLSCVNYDNRGGWIGAPWCYGGHKGTDFMLKGGFTQMDKGNNWVVAAAAGTVESFDDSQYDRCHGAGAGLSSAAKSAENAWRARDLKKLVAIDCDGRNTAKDWNYVRIDHGGGLATIYAHLKNGSVKVEKGQRVRCGERLGDIGSAGDSMAPHLHFQVEYNGKPIDPFQGKLSPKYSFWVDQGRGRLPASRCQ
jgi:murein DD-endopeptidase MepM/ murein hydrolase activator NlpD